MFKAAMDNLDDVIAGKADSGIPEELEPGGGIDVPTAGPKTTRPGTSSPGTRTTATPAATAARARAAQ